MAVTRKIKTNDLDNAINGLMQKPETKTKATAPAGKAEKDKKISVCFQMNESTKNALESYCKNSDMTLTAGIKKAIREMLQRENAIM
jgi:tRNA U34 2-thiouridine synthase MnmA/TrmU